MRKFEIPEPAAASWVSRFYGDPPTIRSLALNTHDLISWETLVDEGITSSRLLSCDPRSVAAWVRRTDGSCVTVSQILALKGGATVTDVLRAWGDRLCPAIASAMQIEDHLTPEMVEALKWTPERWNAVFGRVPVLPSPIHSAAPRIPQPTAAPWIPQPAAVTREVYKRTRPTIGTQILKL